MLLASAASRAFCLAVLGDLARLFAIGHHHELIARLRQAFQAEDLDRGRRRRGFEHAAAIVEHGAHLAEDVADDKVDRLRAACRSAPAR